MDVVRFKGGLGNQMFQYAFVEALKHKGREVYASTGHYYKEGVTRPFILRDVFVATRDLEEIADELFQEIDKRWQVIKQDPHKLEVFKKNLKDRFFYVEENDSVFDERIFQTSNCTFVGYWQSEKYFQDIRSVLQNKYTFNIIDEKVLDIAHKLQNNFFSVHIRLGDYSKDCFKGIYGGICTWRYYHAAMEYIESRVDGAKFIIFSDEIDKIDTEIIHKGNVTLFNRDHFTFYQDWYDMYLMTQCRGNVIANSSFSWWGAWLNQCPNKIVIAPKVWLNGQQTPDIWCDDWIRL